MHTVDLKVYLIAKSAANEESVFDWLRGLGVSPEARGRLMAYDKTGAEQITELAGRRCYKSFEPGLNANVTKIREDVVEYIDNILKVGHGCYDEETDVLTARGWVKWPEVRNDDFFATLNQKTHEVEYHKPKGLLRAPYKGRMYRVESTGVDLLVTPNHMMYVCKTTTRDGRKKQEYRLVKAEELGHASHAYFKSSIPSACEPSKINLDLFRLVGFSVGDGYKSEDSRCVRFHLRRERKIAWLKAVCSRLGIALQQESESDKYQFRIPDDAGDLFDHMYGDDGEKRLPFSIAVASTDQLEATFEGLMQSDGCESPTGDLYDTTSRELADQFQHLCMRIGLAANESQAPCYQERKHSYGSKPILRQYVIRRALKPEVNKWSGAEGRSMWVEDWEGEVFCAEVPNNTLYVRRNGAPVWCGNSVLEHVSFTFAIEGVSRVFTGEMNRHRAGMAISEGSMRYIKFEDIPFWMPDSIRPFVNPDDPNVKVEFKNEKYEKVERKKVQSQDVFKRAFAAAEGFYKELNDIWAEELAPESKFHLKKQITSMMRRIIPMGVATGGLWTGNIRALRHIFNMRCDESAEEEICHVANMMLELMQESEPTFFKDFTKNDKGFYRPKYPKV